MSGDNCCGIEQPLHIAIIGSGSAAFGAAIRATEAGARVTLIEGGEVIGGSCVNVGCVPSKLLISGAQAAHRQAHHPFDGVGRQRPVIDRLAMLNQQQHWVARLRKAKYEDILAQHPDIELVRGWASFIDAHTLVVDLNAGGQRQIVADRVLIAAGAQPHVPDITGLADTPYWTSTEALLAEQLPEHLVVLGGSVVGLELAQAFLHLGVRVTLLARSSLLSREDPALGAGLARVLRDEGMQLHLHTVPDAIHHDGTQFRIRMGAGDDHLAADRLLVATGRRPNTAALNLAAIGVDTNPAGAIRVDSRLRTSASHVYAAGDCTTLPQHVYVAAAAGTRAAVNMTCGEAELDLTVMPAVVFTAPQVASVGLTEQQALGQGILAHSRTLSLDNVPRAIANLDTRGFIKLVAEQHSGRLLGCQALGEQAGELIQAAALALRAGMTVSELADQLFPYLTQVEGLKLCAQTFSRDLSQLSCCAG